MGDFHARMSQLQAMESAWKASEADYFLRSCVWPKKSSPSSYSLKTCQTSAQKGDFASLEKLPKEGMIVAGVLYPLRKLEHRISVKGGSYWPTPRARDDDSTPEQYIARHKKMGMEKKKITSLNVLVKAGPKFWPTPAARDWKDSGNEPSAQARKSPCLPAFVKMYPTPDASNRGARKNQNGHHYTLQDAVGSGKLNPRFVEWLMEYSIGHTELEPWAIAWFLGKRKKRLGC